MLGRLTRDETGIAMGLAIVLIVIVGVMGAGLLVFVRNDLEAVVQVNQGQEAFEAADAGVQAAKRHLITDSCPESYDGLATGAATDEEDPCANFPESDWYAPFDDSEAGKELDFNGKKIQVSIRHLPFPEEAGCAPSDEKCAPENRENGSDKREFFEVESMGMSENDDARRRIKAIYLVEPRAIPKTYFATRDITISGDSAKITGTSIFAGGDIRGLRANTLQADDEVYGDWRHPPWNTTARGFLNAGAGAGGEIAYSAGGGNAADAGAGRYGKYDFDSDSNPKFVSKEQSDGPQDTNELSFPFDTGAVNDELVNFLCEIANEQGNYRLEESGEAVTVDGSDYPSSSDQGTVFCVEFTGDEKGRVDFKAPNRQGTMVVVNGDLEPSPSADTFKGVMVVDDPDPNDDEVTVYKDAGAFALNGYANVEGDMELRGSLSSSGSVEVANRPGFHSVELWSWRELYE